MDDDGRGHTGEEGKGSETAEEIQKKAVSEKLAEDVSSSVDYEMADTQFTANISAQIDAGGESHVLKDLTPSKEIVTDIIEMTIEQIAEEVPESETIQVGEDYESRVSKYPNRARSEKKVTYDTDMITDQDTTKIPENELIAIDGEFGFLVGKEHIRAPSQKLAEPMQAQAYESTDVQVARDPTEVYSKEIEIYYFRTPTANEFSAAQQPMEPDPSVRSETTKSWLIEVIRDVRDVIASRKSSMFIDYSKTRLALDNLEKDVHDWLNVVIGGEIYLPNEKRKEQEQLVLIGHNLGATYEERELYEREENDSFKRHPKSTVVCDTKAKSMSEAIDSEKLKESSFRKDLKKGESKSDHKIHKPPSDMYFVNVTFMLSSEQSFTRTYSLFCSFQNIKQDLSYACMVPANIICLEYEGEVLEEDNLTKIGAVPDDNITLNLCLKDPVRYSINIKDLIEDDAVKEYRTVKVELDKDDVRDIEVEVEYRSIKKPFVGGYRHKMTGLEYHHGFSQTNPRSPERSLGKTHRDTQTVETRCRAQNTASNRATQMWRRDHYIPATCDRMTRPQAYTTADECERRRGLEAKVRVIQRSWRAYKLRQLGDRQHEEYGRYLEWEREQAAKREAEKELRHRREIVYKSFPRTKADFDIMYNMIEKWRRKEIVRVTESKSIGPKKAECFSILEQEILLLKAIEEHRMKLRDEKIGKQEQELITKCAEPVTWTSQRGYTVKMDTLRTQRARELKELYHTLCREDVTIEERIELLMNIKYALLAYNNTTCEEITRLLERECELLLIGIEPKEIGMLRKRINKLFLEYLKDPEFNPQAAKYSMAYTIKHMENTQFYCCRCANLLPHTKFAYSVRMKTIKHCSSCKWIENIAIPRLYLGPYRYIQRAVRRDERKRRCFSSVAFLMQDVDFHFLILNIWHARSILSEKADIDDLRMPRWDVARDWAPWNCILLTDSEARGHEELTTVEDCYAQAFAEDIVQKHELARLHFSQLVKTDIHFIDSGEWFTVRDETKYVSPSPEADVF